MIKVLFFIVSLLSFSRMEDDTQHQMFPIKSILFITYKIKYSNCYIFYLYLIAQKPLYSTILSTGLVNLAHM